MALTPRKSTTASDGIPLDEQIVAAYGDTACDPRGLFEACWDGLMAMNAGNPKASKIGLNYFGTKILFPKGRTESHNLVTLYARLAALLHDAGHAGFQEPNTVDAKVVRETLIGEGVFDPLTRGGFLLRHDPNRPAFTRTKAGLM